MGCSSTIELAPLELKEVIELLKQFPIEPNAGFAEWLWEKSGGVPLFIREILEELIRQDILKPGKKGRVLPLYESLEIPDGIGNFFRMKLERLGKGRERLQKVALFDGPVPESATIDLLGPRLTRKVLKEGILREEQGYYHVSTPLLHELILEDMTAEDRRKSCDSIGRLLIKRGEVEIGIRFILEAQVPNTISAHRNLIERLAYRTYKRGEFPFSSKLFQVLLDMSTRKISKRRKAIWTIMRALTHQWKRKSEFEDLLEVEGTCSDHPSLRSFWKTALAHIHHERNEWKKAIEIAEEALGEGGNKELLMLLGSLYY